MAWRIDFSKQGKRDILNLDRSIQRLILRYLETRIASSDDPRVFGKPLGGNLTGIWRYRVADYRVLCKFEDDELIILVVAAAHRSTVYD